MTQVHKYLELLHTFHNLFKHSYTIVQINLEQFHCNRCITQPLEGVRSVTQLLCIIISNTDLGHVANSKVTKFGQNYEFCLTPSKN